MRIHRRWSSCAVLLAAMSVVSCAEGQFGQVMQNVGKSMAKGMCAEGRGAVSTAPEFCLYIDDIQVGDRDSRVDVVLKAVNRTGQPLHLGISQIALSTSNGSGWTFRGTSGIAWGNGSSPLSLEPGGEGVFTIGFVNGQWGGADTTLSMNGELGILKIDSRGQPAGWFGAGGPGIAASRGFNFSRVGLMQQQPAQPVQQKSSSATTPTVAQGTSPGTNGAAISAGAPAVAPPKVVPLAPPVGPNSIVSPAATTVENSAESIVGMNLGMNVDEIRSAIKAYDPSFQISEKKVQLPGMPNSESVSFFYSWAPVGSGNEENIYVAFIPPPNKNLASIIAREQSFQPEKRLLLSSLQHALIAKYGQPTMKSTLAGGGGEIYTWLLEGKGSSVPGLEQYKKNFCEHANLGEVYDYVKLGGNILSSINRNKLKKDCGKALTILMGVAFNQKDLVQSVISVLVDNPFIDSAFRETDVFLAERDKKQRVQDADRAGRLGKPKL